MTLGENNGELFLQEAQKIESMKGRVIAITGSTSGTGFVLAKTCAEKGAIVLMLNRSSERAETALKEVREVALKKSSVQHITCDLLSFESVRAAARNMRTLLDGRAKSRGTSQSRSKEESSSSRRRGIDVLVNNAAVCLYDDEATEDGYDVQMQVNYLSHFLLTKEVMPLLERSVANHGEARVVNHCSMYSAAQAFDRKYLEKSGGNLGGNGDDNKDASALLSGPKMTRYSQSKLANLAFTYALQDRLLRADTGVKCLAAHPGFSLHTNLYKHSEIVFGDDVVTQSAEDATLGLLKCVADINAQSGDFFGPTSKYENFDGLYGQVATIPVCKKIDGEMQRMLWKESEKAIGSQFMIGKSTRSSSVKRSASRGRVGRA